MKLGTEVRIRRAIIGITQQDFATIMLVAAENVQRLETNKHIPQTSTIKQVKAAFETLESLLNNETTVIWQCLNTIPKEYENGV